MEEPRPKPASYEEFAGMLEHSLLAPDLSEEQLQAGCHLAREYCVAAIAVRPSDIDTAVRLMEGSRAVPASVAGFPHGSEGTAVKLYAARDLLRRGAREIGVVLNTGKLVSREFQYVESELLQLADACHESGAIVKVIFENAYLSEELKIVACKICKRAGVDYAVAATGFGPSGCTVEDLRLMEARLAGRVALGAGGVETLQQALEFHRAGCARFGTAATARILDAWRAGLKPSPG